MSNTIDFSNKIASKNLLADILEPLLLPVIIVFLEIINNLVVGNEQIFFIRPFWIKNMLLFIGLAELFVLTFQLPVYRNLYIVSGNDLFVKEFSLSKTVVEVHIPINLITSVSIERGNKLWFLTQWWHKSLLITIEGKSYTINTRDYTVELYNYIKKTNNL